MNGKDRPKKLKGVNGFKAPEQWKAAVKRIAEERSSTIGGGIIYLVNLGLPIYEVVRKKELQTIDTAIKEFRRIIKEQEDESSASRRSKKSI